MSRRHILFGLAVVLAALLAPLAAFALSEASGDVAPSVVQSARLEGKVDVLFWVHGIELLVFGSVLGYVVVELRALRTKAGNVIEKFQKDVSRVDRELGSRVTETDHGNAIGALQRQITDLARGAS